MLTRSGGVLPSIEDGLPVAKRTRTSIPLTPTATATNTRKAPRNERKVPATPKNFPRQVQKKMATLQRRPTVPRPVPTPNTARRVPRPQQEAITITKTVVDQQYSIEIVKIALTATISSIAYARKILGQDEDNYDFRTIDMKSPEVSYDAFKNGRGKSPWAPRYESMQDLAIITRGNHKAGDKLLDWLEIGVADALEKGYLKGLQLNFSSPEGGTIEKYQIAIENTPSGPREELALSVNAETGSSQPSTIMTTDMANMNLIALSSAIRERMQTSTPLPKGYIMTLDLWLNDKIPVGYSPLGFRTGNEGFVLPTIPSALTLKTPYHHITVHLPRENVSRAARIDQNSAANGDHQIENPAILSDLLLEESQDNGSYSPVTVEDDTYSRYSIDPLSNPASESDEDVRTQVDRLERLETIGTRPHYETERDTQRIESSQPRHIQTPKRQTLRQSLRERMIRAVGSSTQGSPSTSPLSVITRKRSREIPATETTSCLSTQSPQIL